MCVSVCTGEGAQSSATHRTCHTLQHTKAHCNTRQLTATHCNTLQHTATHCNTPQVRGFRTAQVMDQFLIRHPGSVQVSLCMYTRLSATHGKWICISLTATHCNTLQHTTTHYNTRQVDMYQPHCNTLQHTSTHCNTLHTWMSHAAHECVTSHMNALRHVESRHA